MKNLETEMHKGHLLQSKAMPCMAGELWWHVKPELHTYLIDRLCWKLQFQLEECLDEVDEKPHK